jgi:hypothetical protein
MQSQHDSSRLWLEPSETAAPRVKLEVAADPVVAARRTTRHRRPIREQRYGGQVAGLKRSQLAVNLDARRADWSPGSRRWRRGCSTICRTEAPVGYSAANGLCSLVFE